MKADKILSEKGIDYQLVSQNRPTKACDEAAEERGVETSQIIKSLIVRKDEEIIHVCVPGDRKVSEKKFGSYRLVDSEKSKKITGFESGTVHPLSSNLRHVIDERIFERDEVSFTTGSEVEGVILDSEDFLDVLREMDYEMEIIDLAVTSEKELEELKEAGVDEELAEFLMNNGYRSIFFDLEEEFDASDVVGGIRKLHREQIEFGAEEVNKIVERAENKNHMQRLAEKMAENGELPEESAFEIEDVIQNVLKNNEDAVSDYQNGKESALNYLMGKVMESTNGRVDAGKTKQKLLNKLE